ncbi:MAG: hypothetical protein M0P95_15455 [Sulfuritalea sp.]|jgi:polyhydroxyalkanoate synthesis regulator protein|nr:hypothetical protein [Sulfuritalea sp.]
MQDIMGSYVEQSQKLFQQMQEIRQEQTHQMLSGSFVNPDERAGKK